MRRATIVPILLTAVLLGAGTACTSHVTKCANDVCTVDLTGEQTVDIDDDGTALTVGPIEADAVTVSAQGQQTRLGVGQTDTVGGLQVRVRSIHGQDVGLDVQY